jgi:hypothetical protein
MQAKKPILLYCADEALLSAMTVALRLHPYDVTAVSDCNEAVLLAGDRDQAFACAILMHAGQGDFAGRLIHRILERASRLRLLLVDRAGDLAPVRYADIVLYGRNTTMVHIFAALQVLCPRAPQPPLRRAA